MQMFRCSQTRYESFQIRHAPCLEHAPTVGGYIRGTVRINQSEITEENEGTNRTVEGRNESSGVVRSGNEQEPKSLREINTYADYAWKRTDI